MLTTSSRVCAFLLVATLLVSCGMAVRPAETFLTARDDFSEALRWQDCSGAGRYLAAEYQSELPDSGQSDEDLRVVGVQPQSVEFGEDHRSAETVTLLEYYRLPSVVVKKHRLRQQWSYRQDDRLKSGSWQITSPFPRLP